MSNRPRSALVLVPLLCVLAASVACGLDGPDEQPTSLASPTTTTTPGIDAPETPAADGPTPSSTPSPSPTPSPTPSPSPTPQPELEMELGDDMLQLQEDIARAVDGYWGGGNYAVAVTDLQTGEAISIRGDVPQMSGCVMNLFVLFQVARDLEDGKVELEKVDAWMRATPWSSNAATAWELYRIAGNGSARDGVQRVAELIRDLGLEHVKIDHPPGYHADSLGLDYNNWVTAESANQALAALWHGEVVGGEYRDYLLEVLSNVKPGLNYLTAAVPEGIVSHKNGFFVGDTGYVDNDVGIVRLVRGGKEYAYAVSFLSQEVPTKYGDVVLGQQISGMAYEVMAARYPDTSVNRSE